MANLRYRAYGLAALIFAADRLTKWVVETHVSAMDTIHVIPGFFAIVNSQNRGVAFGMFHDSSELGRMILMVVLAATTLFIGSMLWRPEKMDRASFWGLSLVLGGAIGNVFDRVMWGRVTDFLDFYLRDYHWHTFNIADSAIVIGSALMILDMLRPKRQAANVP